MLFCSGHTCLLTMPWGLFWKWDSGLHCIKLLRGAVSRTLVFQLNCLEIASAPFSTFVSSKLTLNKFFIVTHTDFMTCVEKGHGCNTYTHPVKAKLSDMLNACSTLPLQDVDTSLVLLNWSCLVCKKNQPVKGLTLNSKGQISAFTAVVCGMHIPLWCS